MIMHLWTWIREPRIVLEAYIIQSVSHSFYIGNMNMYKYYRHYLILDE